MLVPFRPTGGVVRNHGVADKMWVKTGCMVRVWDRGIVVPMTNKQLVASDYCCLRVGCIFVHVYRDYS